MSLAKEWSDHWAQTQLGDCVKLAIHAQSIAEVQKVPLEIVFQGHVGVVLWRLAVISAARNEGHGGDVSDFNKDTHKLCRFEGKCDDVSIYIRGLGPKERTGILRMLFTSYEDSDYGTGVHGSTTFSYHIQEKDEPSHHATRLRLPASLGVAHPASQVAVLVSDPAELLVESVQRLVAQYDDFKLDPLHGDLKFHDVHGWNPIVILDFLYRLFIEHNKAYKILEKRPGWIQGPFDPATFKNSIKMLLNRKELGDLFLSLQKLIKTTDDRLKGSHSAIGKNDYRRHLEQNLQALKSFEPLFKPDLERPDMHDPSKVRHNSHAVLVHPSYPPNAFEPAARGHSHQRPLTQEELDHLQALTTFLS